MNERTESTEQPVGVNGLRPRAPSLEDVGGAAIDPQAGGGTCGCGAAQGSTKGVGIAAFVYAIGQVEARFPNLAAEKEFAQATGRADTAGKTDQQTFHAVLSKRENRYLVRQTCWVLAVHGQETYLLLPRDPADYDLLVEAVRPAPSRDDIDVVIGMRGPVAPPAMCNGLSVPIVAFDQLYSFDRAALIKSIPRPEKTGAEQFGPVADEVFERIVQLTANAGAEDGHRALNYLAMRYPAIYARTAEAFAQDFSLTGVEVRPSPLSGTRKIVDVVFAYTNRRTDFTEKYGVRVDVTEAFPFLVTKLSPFYDRAIGPAW
jgi:hypothetical protein